MPVCMRSWMGFVYYSREKFCLFVLLFRAAPVAYGGSQARGPIGATAAGIYHSLQQRRILNPLSDARDRTRNLMVPSQIHFHCASEFPLWLSGLRTQLVSMRMQVQSLALFNGLRIWSCHKLWHRSQIWRGSSIAVAVALALSYSSDSTPSL